LGTQYATTFGNQGKPHNYSFTVELHTTFVYRGGEYFRFRGDDDVFVYIDKKRVIDLGGIHGPETANVSVDSLGLTRARHLATAGAVAGLGVQAEYLLVDAWDVPEAPLPQMAVVRGDRTCESIMAASIVACCVI